MNGGLLISLISLQNRPRISSTFLIQDIYSSKLWAKATKDKGSDDYIEVLESLFADTGKQNEINADGKFANNRAG